MRKELFYTLILSISTASAEITPPKFEYTESIPLYISGKLDLGFSFTRDQEGNITGYSNSGAYSNIKINAGVNVPIAIGIHSSITGSKDNPMLWNEPTIWNNPSFLIANIGTFTSAVYNLLNRPLKIYDSVIKVVETLESLGPTEKFIGLNFASLKVSGTSSDTIPILSSGVKLGMNAVFDVNIGENQHVDINQKVTLERLRIQQGASVSGRSDMTIKEVLHNKGEFYNLQGNIEGYLNNEGNINTSNTLNLQGALYNTGQINIAGTFNVHESTSNQGEITLNSGQINSES